MSDIDYHRDIPAEHDWTVPFPVGFCEDVSQEAIDEWIAEHDQKWFPPNNTKFRPGESELKDQFRRHADKWEHETAYLSATPMRVMHQSYQSIIAMGPDVLPLLLRDLQDTHRHWFWALRHLTGEDPVPQDDRGKVDKMINAWIAWGKAKGKL